MEILTILNPGSIDLEPTSRRTDHDGLSAALVSAAMASANPIGVTLLKRRVIDATDSDTGIFKLRSIVKDEARHRKWRFEHEKRLNLLTDLCVWEYTHPPKCKSCEGSGIVLFEAALDGIKVKSLEELLEKLVFEECPDCKGSGEGDNTVVSRAEYLEVSRPVYYKTWERRRQYIAQLFSEMLPDYEFYAWRHIKKYLRNQELD